MKININLNTSIDRIQKFEYLILKEKLKITWLKFFN
jgi:hypothetical protein